MKRTALITAAAALAIAGVPVGATSANAATGCPGTTRTVILPDNTKQSITRYFCHAGVQQLVYSTGAAMTTTIWDPPVSQNEDHSLAELAVRKGARTAIVSDDQSIEIGWRVSPKSYGDQLPHLFIYYWVNGLAYDCYNSCPAGAFVSQSSTIKPGMALPTGTSQTFAIDYTGGQWYLYYGGTWFGYLNSSLWNGTYTQSDAIQIFGEVASTMPDPPCTNMGDGNLGSSATGALVSNVGFYGATDPPALVLTPPENPSLYDAKIMSASSFQYGGPGLTTC